MKNSTRNTFILTALICAFLVHQPVYAGFFDFIKEAPRKEHRHGHPPPRHYDDGRDDRRDHHRDDRDRRYDRRDDRRDHRDDRDRRYDRRDDRRDDHKYSKPSKGWRSVGSASAGSAKEFSFNGARECYIEVTSGSVSINTVVVRRGGQKHSVPVVTRLSQGQRFNVPIDMAATGLRISTGGKGSYRVYVK